MGSATVDAQRLANEANISMTNAMNQSNYGIAHENNLYNLQMMHEQNLWNREQWDLENQYNDPSRQVERYLAAGINPLWAMTGGDPGNAAHLESADAKPAEAVQMKAAHVDPEYDPYLAQHVGNIVTAARDVVNGVQGFMGLDLEKQDVETRQAAQVSRSSLDRASALEKRASTVGREIENDWNLQTFDVRARQESQKLQNLISEESNIQADTKEKEAKKLEIEEHKNLMTTQIYGIVESVKQRQDQISIARYNAETGRMEAHTASARLKLEDEKFSQEIKQWNNQNLLQFMYKFGRTVTGSVKGGVEIEGLGISGSAGYKEQFPADVQKAISCGIEILERAADDPADVSNMKDAEEASKIIDLLLESHNKKNVVPVDKLFNSTSSSIFNPSDKW